MSKVKFKFQMGIQAEDKVTGFKGLISCRTQQLNGCIQYGIQPPCKKGTSYVPESMAIDEDCIVTKEEVVSESVEFKYETGDRIKSRVTGFEGIITNRTQFLNKCVYYSAEGKMEGKERNKQSLFEQEIQFLDKGLNAKEESPVERKRTGGPMTRTLFLRP